MINFNKFNINILSFFISSIIFIILISIINYPQTTNKEKITLLENKENVYNDLTNDDVTEKNIISWSIEIKSLGIKANINQIEGDIPDDDYVGHFKNTSIIGKNIALIAFNFGKAKNYFANLKDLKSGDDIIYNVNDEVKKYKVIYNQIIEKESLKSIIEDYNNNSSCLKLFTYIKDINDKLRYVYAEETIDI